MSAGSAAQMFKSVPYLRAMCSPKFRTILIKNGRLRAIFTSKWRKFCPSGPISHKPFNILFWNITHLFVTCAIRSAKFQKIRIQNTRLRALFTKLWNFLKSHVYGKHCPNFQLFPNLFVASVPALWSNIYLWGYYCLSDILVILCWIGTPKTVITGRDF